MEDTLLSLKVLIDLKLLREINNTKLYRELMVDYNFYKNDDNLNDDNKFEFSRKRNFK